MRGYRRAVPPRQREAASPGDRGRRSELTKKLKVAAPCKGPICQAAPFLFRYSAARSTEVALKTSSPNVYVSGTLKKEEIDMSKKKKPAIEWSLDNAIPELVFAVDRRRSRLRRRPRIGAVL